jgi:hypothetical protein
LCCSDNQLRGGGEGLQAPLVQLEEAGGSAVLDQYEPGFRKPAKVLGHRRLADVETFHDLAHSQRPSLRGEEMQNQDSRRIGEASKPIREELGVCAVQLHRSSTIGDRPSASQAPTLRLNRFAFGVGAALVST